VSPHSECNLNYPLVSLIVTTHTKERLEDVAHLLKSVCRQILENVEVVFVGEGVPQLCEDVVCWKPSAF
jgi:hypothetical protein